MRRRAQRQGNLAITVLVALPRVLFQPGGQIQRHQGKPGLAVQEILEAHNVLVAPGAGLQLQAVLADAVIPPVDLYLGALLVIAGQPLGGDRGLSHRSIALAGNHVAVTAQRLLVEGGTCSFVSAVA